MSDPGESLDPVRMLNVASWRKLRASRGRVRRGRESQNLRPPNMRVQRTRPLASLGTLTSFARSPLTRCPLGARVAAVGAISALLGIACARPIVDYTIMVTGVVVDQLGQPVRDAHVTVDFPITVYSAVLAVTHGEAWTGQDGRFGFDFMSHGPADPNIVYSLVVAKPGYSEVSIEGATQATGPHRIVLETVK